MSDDLWNDPDVQSWVADAREHLIPKIEGSDATISLVPDGEGDIKFAVELGLSIMMNKPIIAVVIDNRNLPDKLVQVADTIVHLHSRELGTASGQKKVHAAIERILGPDEESNER
jgi:hypothetical protein